MCVEVTGDKQGPTRGQQREGHVHMKHNVFETHYLQAAVERMIVIIIRSEIQRDKRNHDEGKEEANKNNYVFLNFVSETKWFLCEKNVSHCWLSSKCHSIALKFYLIKFVHKMWEWMTYNVIDFHEGKRDRNYIFVWTALNNHALFLYNPVNSIIYKWMVLPLILNEWMTNLASIQNNFTLSNTWDKNKT